MAAEKLETGIDFVQCLDTDLSMRILSCIDDPADLVRASSVSHTWRNFMLANGLAKKLCSKRLPFVSNIVDVLIMPSEPLIDIVKNQDMERQNLVKDHEAYAALLYFITDIHPTDCSLSSISASSTLNPAMGINCTLVRDGLFWMSNGQSNPDVPETLTYKLIDRTLVITEIDMIKPAEASLQQEPPTIYSAKSVRIRIGHPKHYTESEPADNQFVWTYTSPEFPMTQESYLQSFTLPEPVVCVDGYVQIELLGKVQIQQLDGLYYAGISFVRVLGWVLYPSFDIKVLETYEKLSLTYNRKELTFTMYRDFLFNPTNLSKLIERVDWLQLSDFARNLLAGEDDYDEESYAL